MIRSFKSKALERFSAKGDASKLSVQNTAKVTRVLQTLDDAARPEDVNQPGWRFHQLSGDRAGTYSVTVSGNWRITFKFDGEDATEVDLEDYH